MKAVGKFKSIKPEIFVEDGLKEYTNGDTIVGRAVVQLDKTIDIEDITIWYSVRAKTVVRVTTGDSSTTYYETSAVYEDSHRVFPPTELTNKSFTLQAGSHSFDFSFTIPARNLPASFHDNLMENMIVHLVQVKVKRPSWYKMNSDASKSIKFAPQPDPTAIFGLGVSTTQPKKVDLNSKRQGVFARRKSEVSVTVRAPQTVATNSNFGLSMTFDSVPFQDDTKQPLKVAEVSIRLVSFVSATARRHTDNYYDSSKMLLEGHQLTGAQGEVVDIEVDTLKLGKITPSFSTPTLQLKWCLEIVVKVSNCYRSKLQKFRHSVAIRVVADTASPQYPGGSPLPVYSKHENLEGADECPAYG